MTEREFGTCPSGSWGACPNAFNTHDKGWPTMRCKLSGQHPDLCHNYSKPIRTIQKPESSQNNPKGERKRG